VEVRNPDGCTPGLIEVADCGAWEVSPGKKLFIPWPAGESLPR